MLETKNLCFSYAVAERRIEVLKNFDFEVNDGEFVGIQGPSGSGKSTLFYLLGFLLKPTSGVIKFDGIDITKLAENELAVLRNKKIGFVFQQFHLLSKTSVLENILLPTKYPSELSGTRSGSDFSSSKGKGQAKALELAKQVGLQTHLDHLPNQLSGGQQQRVAIARALMNDVDLILADEPTGNLDSQNAVQILDLLTELNNRGKTIILITHDSEVAKYCSKVYHLRDGQVTSIQATGVRPQLKQPGVSRSTESLPNVKLDSFASYRKTLRAVFPLVIENLFRNKSKSLLTMLGVVIGVAAILAMVTVGQFAKRKILETYETLGVNKLVVRGSPNWDKKATDSVTVNFREFNWGKDILPLKTIFPEISLMSPTLDFWHMRVLAGGIEAGENKVAVYGVTPEYLAITNRKLELGRNLSTFNVENRSPVCVIGFGIASRLFELTPPLNQVITITDGRQVEFPCKVIGVLSSLTSNVEWAPPNFNVFIPYTYFQSVNDSGWSSGIHDVTMQVVSGADIEATGKKIKSYFQQKYGKSGQFRTDSDSTLIAQMKKFLNIFAALLAAIALLSLIVGGIGINNMMLVSVTERIKEFGIRKALGATNQSIRAQVLMESVTLCLLAGVLGVVVGFGSYELLIFGATKFLKNLKFEWIFEPLAAVLSLVSIVAVGIGSGFIPALRAEKLQVIEALRSE